MDAGEIIVTATKRETNLQQTPISIAVMGNEQLKQRHVQILDTEALKRIVNNQQPCQ